MTTGTVLCESCHNRVGHVSPCRQKLMCDDCIRAYQISDDSGDAREGLFMPPAVKPQSERDFGLKVALVLLRGRYSTRDDIGQHVFTEVNEIVAAARDAGYL